MASKGMGGVTGIYALWRIPQRAREAVMAIEAAVLSLMPGR